MDKILLKTFAVIAVSFVVFLGFTAILQGQTDQQPLVLQEATEWPVSDPAGDAERGQEIFQSGADNAPACAVCHLIEKVPGRFGVGPNLKGVATRAAERVEGVSAEEYLYDSIVDPGSYVVDGFTNAMFPKFADVLTDEQLDDVVAYLLTLE